MINIPIDGGFYESASLPISAQSCINYRVNIPQTEGALNTATLFGTSGLVQLATSGAINNENRGSHVKASLPYFLNGTVLFRLDRTVDPISGNETFNLVTLGTIPGTGFASFADNGTQLIVIAGGRGWIIDETQGVPFVEITAPGFTANGTPQQVKFIDSFFLVTTNSKKFIRSDSNNGLVWNALNFFTAEADPDNIVAPIIFKNQAYIAGSETIEVFQDLAGTFQRISGQIINKGVFSPFGITNTSDGFMFIGGGVNESPAIWQVSGAGSAAQKISTTAIDNALGDLTVEQLNVSFAYSFAQKGAYIIGFSFPKFTFEYNTITGKWNQRSSRITDSIGRITNDRWRVNSMVTAYNRILCADQVDGRIGSLEDSIFIEYTETITRTFVTRPFSNQGKSFSISKLEMTVESGVATTDTDPIMRLSVSSDGGHTFNNELQRTFGGIGEYFKRVIWRRLGRFSRFAALKFETSSSVKPVIIKLEAKLTGGIGE